MKRIPPDGQKKEAPSAPAIGAWVPLAYRFVEFLSLSLQRACLPLGIVMYITPVHSVNEPSSTGAF